MNAFSTRGNHLWTINTGAYVYSSPAIWRGRVYFETVLPSMPEKVPLAREAGFTYVETDDGRWRVFTNVSPQGIVQVGQPVVVVEEELAVLRLLVVGPQGGFLVGDRLFE